MTVPQIRELSGRLTIEQWETMRDLEEAGKCRTSAINFIDAAIQNLR